MSPVRIVLADDHTIMRHGLRLVLERQPDFAIVGEANNGREAIVTLSGPRGADNVDPWRVITDSLRWTR